MPNEKSKPSEDSKPPKILSLKKVLGESLYDKIEGDNFKEEGDNQKRILFLKTLNENYGAMSFASEVFDISNHKINKWRSEDPYFSEAIKKIRSYFYSATQVHLYKKSFENEKYLAMYMETVPNSVKGQNDIFSFKKPEGFDELSQLDQVNLICVHIIQDPKSAALLTTALNTMVKISELKTKAAKEEIPEESKKETKDMLTEFKKKLGKNTLSKLFKEKED